MDFVKKTADDKRNVRGAEIAAPGLAGPAGQSGLAKKLVVLFPKE